jgi:hypothetical protein
MRKLKLDIDSLQVESFVSTPPAAEVGTVQGQKNDGPFDVDFFGDSTTCDGAGWGSLFGTCEKNVCPTAGTCVGPTYCCKPTWRTCNPSCDWTCPDKECPGI